MNKKKLLPFLYLNTAYWGVLGILEGIGFFPGVTRKLASVKGASPWDDAIINEYWEYVFTNTLSKSLILWVLGLLVILLFTKTKGLNGGKLGIILFIGSLGYAAFHSFILEFFDLSAGLRMSELFVTGSGWFFFLTVLLNASLSYWLFIIALYAYDYFQRYKEEKIINLELRNSLSESRLESLVYQLRPHFLFNVMNSISMLVRTNENEKANRVITGLSDLLRATLKEEKRQLVPLVEEMEFTSRYLDLEERLYSEHLNIEIEMSSQSEHVLVPHLILQPLIENAFKHGIAKVTSVSFLKIKTMVHDSMLNLEVINTGPLLKDGWVWEEHMGIGLTNVYKRLQNIYGDNFNFMLKNNSLNEVVAHIQIPVRS